MNEIKTVGGRGMEVLVYFYSCSYLYLYLYFYINLHIIHKNLHIFIKSYLILRDGEEYIDHKN